MRYFGNKDYVTIKAPDYPGYKYQGLYCYEHHYVWWKNTGELVNKNINMIHHVNGNKKDNVFENLKKITLDEHNKIHRKGKPLKESTKKKLRIYNLKNKKQILGYYATYIRKDRDPSGKVWGSYIPNYGYMYFNDPISCEIIYNFRFKEEVNEN